MGRDEDIFTYFEECSGVPGRPAEVSLICGTYREDSGKCDGNM
jgi:hypothetical protein